MIRFLTKTIASIIKCILFLSCALVALLGGVTVIAATEISSWDRFTALVATIFFGFCCFVIIELGKSE